jgi:hypothetical protein
MDTDIPLLNRALQATGDLLERHKQRAAIVVVGGTALNLLGVISRSTNDVDVIATATPRDEGPPEQVRAPDPLPAALRDAIATVTRDLGLPSTWLNTTVASQWQTGLPSGFAERITWRRYGGLWVGLAGRLDLIHFKLYAAADDVGPASRHFKDLVALAATAEELTAAAEWIASQDPSAAVADAVRRVIVHVRAARR